MKNFPIQDSKGNTWWVSRAVSVTGLVFTTRDGTLYILVNKRGKGTPDFQGYWNVPCGYLDYDETGQEACSREVFEETGIKISPNLFSLMYVSTSPLENRQNIALRYSTWIPNGLDLEFSTANMEADEVEEVRWIKVADIDKYQWAFNHNQMILNSLKLHHISSKNYR